MAKISGSAMGQFRNKFGNAVAAMWQSINVARIYQPAVSNPNTEKQVQVRARFSALVKLAKSFRSALIVGLRKFARSKVSTIYGTFTQLNWEAVGASSPDDVTVNYSELVITEGSAVNATYATPEWGEGTHLKVSVGFTYPQIEGVTSMADELYMVLYAPDLGESILSHAVMASGDAIEVTVPSNWNGLQAHMWCFTISRYPTTDGSASRSVYLGHNEIQ